MSNAHQPSTRDSAASRTAVGSSVVDSEGFQKPRDQRIRERRQARTNGRTVLYGSNKSSGTLKAGKQMRELFVCNLDQDTTETDLIEYLKVKAKRHQKLSVNPAKMQRINHFAL